MPTIRLTARRNGLVKRNGREIITRRELKRARAILRKLMVTPEFRDSERAMITYLRNAGIGDAIINAAFRSETQMKFDITENHPSRNGAMRNPIGIMPRHSKFLYNIYDRVMLKSGSTHSYQIIMREHREDGNYYRIAQTGSWHYVHENNLIPVLNRTHNPSDYQRNGAYGYDKSDEAVELLLFIQNDSDLYRQQGKPIEDNLNKKTARGVYDSKLAAKLYGYLADEGAKKYAADFGSRGDKWFEMFPPNIRREVANELRDYFEAEIQIGIE